MITDDLRARITELEKEIEFLKKELVREGIIEHRSKYHCDCGSLEFWERVKKGPVGTLV